MDQPKHGQGLPTDLGIRWAESEDVDGNIGHEVQRKAVGFLQIVLVGDVKIVDQVSKIVEVAQVEFEVDL